MPADAGPAPATDGTAALELGARSPGSWSLTSRTTRKCWSAIVKRLPVNKARMDVGRCIQSGLPACISWW